MKRYWNFESFTLRFEFSSSKFSLNYKNWCWKGEIISEVTSLHLGPTMETTTPSVHNVWKQPKRTLGFNHGTSVVAGSPKISNRTQSPNEGGGREV
jgi:hypothetical protein